MGDHVRTHYLRHKHVTGAIVGMEGPLIVAVALVDQVTRERAAKEVKINLKLLLRVSVQSAKVSKLPILKKKVLP